MAKKKHHEEHENHERWLVSYADFITLLFAFFVVMYAVSRVDTNRLTQASNAIRWALHFEGTGGVRQLPIFQGPPSEGGCAANLGETYWKTPQGMRELEEIRKKVEMRLRGVLVERGLTAAVQVVVENQKLTLRLGAEKFFDPSQAAIRPEMMPVLDAIAGELGALQRTVRVEGHTDDLPVPRGRYRNNWDLSASRAATVVGYLEEVHKFPPTRLLAAGYGSSRPVEPNDTPEHREANRRIEMTLELEPGDAWNAYRPR